jgi:hypothetical protein
MAIPDEVVSLLRTPSERKIFSIIYRTSVDGVSEVSTEEMCSETGYSGETLRRAFREFERRGILHVERTRKSYSHIYSNRWSNNRYHIKLGYADVGSSVVGSSCDTGDSTVVPVGKLVGNEHTSYVHMPQAAKTEVQEMARWKNDDEDDVGGFGLFEEEVQQKVASTAKPINKRDTSTRGRRPEAEWTVYDIASEFSHLLSRKFPYIPGLVNVRNISGALRGWRNQYGTTATVEMEMMRKFFADERNWLGADKEPEKIHLRYLRMFKTHMQEINASFDIYDSVESSDLTTGDDYLYSSDGRRFDNTLIGRKALARYEDSLGE